MTRLLPALLALSFLSFLPQQARAESEIYGGVGLGYSTLSVDDIDFEASGNSFRQFAGFRYGDYVALEAGFTDFGKADDEVFPQPGQPSLNYSIDTWGYNLSLVGRYPLNQELVAFGKLGMVRWDSEIAVETVPAKATADGDDLMYGVGVDYRGAGRFHVRMEFEFVDIDVADSWWVAHISLMYGIPLSR